MALGRNGGVLPNRLHRNRFIEKLGRFSMIGPRRAVHAVTELLERRVLLSAVSLVDNINKVTDSSNPSNFVVAGNELFFTADDGIHGQELWKSDGTSSGTVMVSDLVPGSTGSGAQPFAAMGNDVFFTTTSGGLYISDGTAAGTMQLSSVTPNVSNWTVYNGRLYFQGTDADHGSELWSSDGTAAGTSLLADIASGMNSSSPTDLVALNGDIYFAANTSTSGNELWKTDGTIAGTTLVADINPGTGSSNPTALATMNNKLYFIASSSGTTSNLYVSDGTAAGTSEVSTVPAAGLASNTTLSVVGSTLYFLGTDAIDGQGLWKSDGTAAGTVSFGPASGTSSTMSFSQIYSINGSEYFWTYSTTAKESLIWRISAAGSVTSLSYAFGFQFGAAVIAGNYLYFSASDSMRSFWRTDGTNAGTIQLCTYETDATSLPDELANVNGTVVFNGGLGGDYGTPDVELVGVPQGSAQPILIKEINTQAPYGSNLQYPLIKAGNQAYFTANDGGTMFLNPQLWVTDGTEGGTRIVRTELNIGHLVAASLGNSLLFVDFSSTNNGTLQLWKTDGTPGGTVVLQDLSALNVNNPSGFVTAGNLVYFQAGVQGAGEELWVSDGTSTGTHLIYVFTAFSAGSLTAVGDDVYFQVRSTHGNQLWKSDGTTQGTVMIDDAVAGSGSNSFSGFTDVDGTLYLVSFPSSGPSSLWKSDGTAAGTVKITDALGQLLGSFGNLTAVGDELYFTADTAANGVELWKTDGTSAGTQMVDDLTPGPGSSSFEQLESAGNSLYFSALDSNGLGQLFRTDGTATGTIQLTQRLTYSNGTSSGYHGVTALNAIGTTIYFEADDGIHGDELWGSDGTPAGTAMVQDIGPGNSVYVVTCPMDTYLLFAADDHQIGEELWRTGSAPTVATGSISGNIFYDTNGNGLQDGSEQALPFLGVYLDTNADGLYESTEPLVDCDSSGQYTFTNVLPGIYRVRPMSQYEWSDTAPLGGAQVVTVAAGQAVTNINLGEIRGQAGISHSTSSTAIFSGTSYSLNLMYFGPNSATSWTINWGDGSSLQTLSGYSATHTYAAASGTTPFTILAWANTVDGTIPSKPLTAVVYAAPLLSNGVLSLSGTARDDVVSFTSSGGVLAVKLDGAIEQFNSSLISKVTYSDPSGYDIISLSGAIPATLTLSPGSSVVSNSDSSPVYIAAGTGKTTINATSGTTIIPANNGTGIQRVDFAAINISAGAKVIFATSSATVGNYSKHANRSVAVIDAGGLNVASGGILDMGDNDMILHYASANETAARNLVSGLLASGFDGGGFDTAGINSSAASYDAYNGSGTRALGWMDNNDIGATTFDGVNTSDLNEVMVKFTYYGDSDLNGVVDATDFGLYAAGKSNAGTGWAFGNYDYNATTTDATDFGLFAAGLQGYRQFGAL